MPELSERLLCTESYDSFDLFLPKPDSVLLFGRSVEFRSLATRSLDGRVAGLRLVEIRELNPAAIEKGGEGLPVALRSDRQLGEFWDSLGVPDAYLDITGLSHGVWAPLVRSAVRNGIRLRVMYLEPGSYQPSPNPIAGDFFDLSERILGIAPLAGFASLSRAVGPGLFVPLLGFEGTRLAHLVESIEPLGGNIVPVVGVPGFRPEYPFHTYIGNQQVLHNTGSWKQVRFAQANCPFSLYYTLAEIERAWPSHRLQIAPIGTKPHALGAVLYAMEHESIVELVYDHPVRKSTRTSGADRLSVYDIDRFFDSV